MDKKTRDDQISDLQAQVSQLQTQLYQVHQKFALALQGSPVCIFIQDHTLKFTDVYNAPEGFDGDELIGRTDQDVLPPEAAKKLTAAKRAVVDDCCKVTLDLTFDWLGRQRSFKFNLEPYYVTPGVAEGVIGVAIDLSTEMAREANLHDALREMSHRTRNQLAALSSIVRHTSRAAPSIEAYATKLEARIDAMGLTQAMLVDAAWAGISLTDLVEHQFSLVLRGAIPVSVNGPPVFLRPEPAQNLGLALHEFVQNAHQNFRAESGAKSQIEVTWASDEESGAVELLMTEKRKTPTGQTPSQGFGTLMIRRVLPTALGAGASANVSYEPTGATARITIPKSCLLS